jgi:predicted dehydrogenase
MSLLKPVRDLFTEFSSQVSARVRAGSRLKIGFVGCGQHARTNLYPVLQFVRADLQAVCARRLENAEAAAKAFGAPSAYASFEAMFDKEPLDAVLVCVSADEHFRIAAAALERGLHVFVEKPATRTLGEAEQLRHLERKAGRHLMVGFQKRHAPAYRKAWQILRGESFGALSTIDVRFCFGSFPGDEEFLREVAIHHLDLIRFFAGNVEAVHAERHRSRSGGFAFAVTARFEGGAVGTMRLSTEQSWRAHNERVELSGEGESLVVENMVSLRHYKGSAAKSAGEGPFRGEGEAFWEPNFTVPTIWNQTHHLNGFGFELEHFVECLLAGNKPEPGIEDYCRSLQMVDSILGRQPANEGAK